MHPAVQFLKAGALDLQAGLSSWSLVDYLRYFGLLVGAIVVYTLVRVLISNLTSPLKHIPGPRSPSLLFGNLWEIFREESCAAHERWFEQYGDTFKYKVLLSVRPFIYSCEELFPCSCARLILDL